MKLHIIHLRRRTDRHALLMQELQDQGITDFRLWEGIETPEKPVRGISRAHKQIVRHALAKGWPEVMIAEDDLHFTDQGALDYYLSQKPPDFDLYLGGVYFGKINQQKMVTDFSGLTLYTVAARFYESFLAADEEKNIDRAMRRKGRFFVCDPMIVTQHNGYSDNARKEVDYDHWLEGRRLFRRTNSAL